MLESRRQVESFKPEQQLDLFIQGSLKLLGYELPIGKRSYRQSEQGFVQTSLTHAQTLQEGHYDASMLVLTVRDDASSGMILNGAYLSEQQTITIGVGGDYVVGISKPGTIYYSLGADLNIIQSDRRFKLLGLDLPEKSKTLPVSDSLRHSIIERSGLLLESDLDEREFHMELLDIIFTTLSATSLTPVVSNQSNRMRIVQRAIDGVRKMDPRNLSPQVIANSSFSSIRTLEYAFKEVLNLSPKQYIDFYRINLLRENIIARPHIPIMHLGHEVGIAHLGNLSRNYKALYGETPSETKRRLRLDGHV